MGVEQARTNNGTATSIAAVSNPPPRSTAQRLARFIRIEKPVSIPDDDDIADPDNSAFGPSGRMREIVAYAPIEPDGSVRMKMPGERRVPDQSARRRRPPRESAASLLALGTSGRSAVVQRLPYAQLAHRAAVARSQGPLQQCLRGIAPRPAPPSRAPSTRSRPMPVTRWRGRVRARFVVHRPGDNGRALRPAVGDAERERGLQRDLDAGRAADRLVRLQLPDAHDGAARPTSIASRSGPRPAASRFTTRPSARVRVRSIRSGPCRGRSAVSMTARAISSIRRRARTAIPE